MTANAVEGGFALGVAIDAEAHVDFKGRHDAIHSLDRSVTALALDSCVDMRVMREADDRLYSTLGDSVAVASDTSRDRWNSRLRRSRRVSVAVLTWNLVDPGVDSMTERDRLNDICARRPWPFGERDHSAPKYEQEQGKRKHYAIHAHDGGSRLRPPGADHRGVRQPVRNAEQPKLSAETLLQNKR